jgi:SAM-dependent methyltransferase
MTDHSHGYDNITDTYIQHRSNIGIPTIRSWAQNFAPGATILDLGCGHGIPVTRILLDTGLSPHAIDASQNMVAAFKQNFPGIPVACEPAEQSGFFQKTFDGIIAIGLLFLLPEPAQHTLLQNIAKALHPGGRLLFTAPAERANWTDVLTGLPSQSLGENEYQELLLANGLLPETSSIDEGGNHYYNATKKPVL